MARIKYYYDTETCNFERVKWDAKTIVRKLVSYLTVGGIIAGLAIAYLFYIYENPAVTRLKAENQDLESSIAKFDAALAKLETDLETLHRRDEQVYRTIMKADPLTTEWQGGTGGQARFKDVTPKALQNTKNKLDRIESKLKIQKASYNSLVSISDNLEEKLKHMPSIRPIATDLISGFGYRMHPILKVRKLHTGLDFRAPMGTPVYATADGEVKHAGRRANGYGIHVDLDHGYGFETKYAHLSKILVKEGQKVKRGEVIGLSGNTGLSKGPHLHYEILREGSKIDPVDYFYSDLTPEQYVTFKKLAQQYNESMD